MKHPCIEGGDIRPEHGSSISVKQLIKDTLLPIMWGTGTGSEVMSRIAAPMVGGMISSTVLTLAVIPAIYALVKQWRMKRGMEQ